MEPSAGNSRLFRIDTAGYGPLLWGILPVGVLSIIQAALGYPMSWQVYLSAARSTPWGIVTSLFLHRTLGHFINDFATLCIYSALLVPMIFDLDREERRSQTTLLIAMAYGSAVLANAVWVILTPASSMGSSGLDYGLIGVILGLSLHNVLSTDPLKHLGNAFWTRRQPDGRL